MQFLLTRLLSMRLVLFVSLVAFGALASGAPVLAQSSGDPTPETIDEVLEAEEFDPFREIILAVIAQRGEEGENLPVMADYYGNADNPAIWISDGAITERAQRLVQVLQTAHLDVLDPADYDAESLAAQLDASLVPELAALEVGLSLALLDYTRHISSGRVDPRKVNAEIALDPEFPDPMGVLRGAATAQDIVAYATYQHEPQTKQYARLRTALAAYRALAAVGGWPQISGGETLKEGMSDPVRVAALRSRLEISGDLLKGAHSGDALDGALVDGLKTFQGRHGLEIDGAVGPNTLAELNTTVAQRVEQIEINMERRRWMADDPGKFYIFVNLADQFLKVVEWRDDLGREKTVHTALTVIGKSYHRTPVFSESMSYVVINPSWNVPQSIAVNEFLPKLKRNPGVLSAQNIRLLSNGRDIDPYSVNWASVGKNSFRWRLQQRPGRNNALGQIKFMFPNKYNVYIHDTPSKALFSRAQRAFSHGCVRVQYPFDLAQVLLDRQGMSKAQIDAIRAKGVERIVRLKEPIPVHINYLTAWANRDGTMHFRRDIYGRDAILGKVLQDAKTG